MFIYSSERSSRGSLTSLPLGWAIMTDSDQEKKNLSQIRISFRRERTNSVGEDLVEGEK